MAVKIVSMCESVEERAVWSTAWVSWVLYISRLGISHGNDPSDS